MQVHRSLSGATDRGEGAGPMRAQGATAQAPLSCPFAAKKQTRRTASVFLIWDFVRTLAHTLVVGDTFRLGRPGSLGSESQNDQRDDVGEHAVKVRADADL